MRWKTLTPEQLVELAATIGSHADDLLIDRESMIAERGFDVYGGLLVVVARLKREAARRKRKASATE